jgi:hypothetical protein
VTDWGRYRKENAVKMDFKETGCAGCGLDASGLGKGPVAGCCEQGK